jgi:signal transduction histidine kinase
VEAGLVIPGDEELLERAFENLVRNAREAAGPSGHVVVSVRPEADRLQVEIADDGPGLPRATRDALRPFFSTKSGGLGLGLAIALKLLRLHGGELAFQDNVPRGVRVVVTLPRGGSVT